MCSRDGSIEFVIGFGFGFEWEMSGTGARNRASRGSGRLGFITRSGCLDRLAGCGGFLGRVWFWGIGGARLVRLVILLYAWHSGLERSNEHK